MAVDLGLDADYLDSVLVHAGGVNVLGRNSGAFGDDAGGYGMYAVGITAGCGTGDCLGFV